MSSIDAYFKNAELAMAAYADLVPGEPDIQALEDDGNGMSSTQAKEFAENWRVVDQFNSPLGLLDGYTGLSATFFEHVVDTKEQVIAIRGTQPLDPNDLLTDAIDIILLGNTNASRRLKGSDPLNLTDGKAAYYLV